MTKPKNIYWVEFTQDVYLHVLPPSTLILNAEPKDGILKHSNGEEFALSEEYKEILDQADIQYKVLMQHNLADFIAFCHAAKAAGSL